MNTKQIALPLLLTLNACAADVTVDDDLPSVDDFDDSKEDASAPTPRLVYCHATDAAAELVKLVFTPSAKTFDIQASTKAGVMFALASQRPSLNVQVEDGAGTVPHEFLDFRPSGLEVVPPIGASRFEITMATGDKTLTYTDASTQRTLRCVVSAPKLLAFLGIAPVRDPNLYTAKAVGFDIDDTLLFSTPAFARAFATGGAPKPDDVVFWTQANGCDPGCAAGTITLPDGTVKQLPANVASPAKDRVRDLVAMHQARGAEVYAITARPDIQGNVVRNYIQAEFGIPADHVFFEPDVDQVGNPAGKTDRMASLKLDVFYGDADSDITDAQKVPVRGVRVLRSPKSSNRKDGRLAKYHPGYFGETILAGSYD